MRWNPLAFIRRSLVLCAFAGLAGCAGESSAPPVSGFKQADLAGTWRFHVFSVGSSVANGALPGWTRGTLDIGADGVVTLLTYADSKGNTTVPLIPPIMYSLNSDGIVTSATTAFAAFHGKMNPGKTFFVATDTQGTGPDARPQLRFYQRVVPGTSYGAADLAGKVLSFHQVTGGAAAGWFHGTVTVATNGLYDLSDLVSEAGTRPDVLDLGPISVNADGVVSVASSPTFAGFLSADKAIMVGTETFGANEHAVTVAMLRGPPVATADLAGAWSYYNLGAQIAGGYWARGSITLDAAGAGTFGTQVDSTNGTGTPDPITIAVGADGIVTQAAPAPSVFHGALSRERDILVATDTHDEAAGLYGMIVVVE